MSVKKLANPNQNAANLLKTHTSEMGCCDGENLSTKKYELEVDYTKAITSVTVKIDGVNTELPIGLPINSTKKQLREALAAALMTKGFDPYFGSDNYRGISTEGNVLSVIGEAELVNLKNTATKAFTVLGTPSRIIKTRWTVAESTAFGDLLNEGEAAATSVGVAAGYTDGDEAAVVTAMKTALTAQNVVHNKVTASLENGIWTVDVYAVPESYKLTLNDVQGNRVDAFPGFIA